MSLTYKQSGVDIDAGNALVKAIGPLAKSTARPGCDAGLGGFGGVFDLKAAGFEDPLLIAANDGVGTKLKIAIEAEKHDTVGIDLVAMCVNDLIVQGAEPLFFLDYIATGKLDVTQMTSVVAGIAEGCRQAGCGLIGGETAEMPGLYQDSDYDLAGFAVGAVNRDALLPKSDIGDGDVLIGLSSNGLHSNGFSLVRKVIESSGVSFNAPAPFDGRESLAEALLRPTKIYVNDCLPLARTGYVKGLAHITGGGLVENISRVLPDGLDVRIDCAAWTLPDVFSWLAHQGGINGLEMLRTFNCGIGMVLISAPEHADQLLQSLPEGSAVGIIGQVVKANEPHFDNLSRII